MAEIKQALETARSSKDTRIWFMVGLLVVLFILWWFNIIKTGFAIGIGILLLAAIGIQSYSYDLDLGTLWKTGNIQESRTQQVTMKDGTVVKLTGNCVKPAGNDAGFDLNCNNFKTQPEAQAKYNECANSIALANKGLDTSKIMSLDVYGLDGNKNGIVCESLPGSQKVNTSIENTPTPLPSTPERAQAGRNATPRDTKTTGGTYSENPLLRTPKPYTATPASDRTNTKILPTK